MNETMGIKFNLSGAGRHTTLQTAAHSLANLIQEIGVIPVAHGWGDNFGTLVAMDDEDSCHFLAGLYITEYCEGVPRITWWKTDTLIIHGGIYPGTANELTVCETELVLYLAGLAFFLAGASMSCEHREWFRDRSRLTPQPDWAVFEKNYVWTEHANSAYQAQQGEIG